LTERTRDRLPRALSEGMTVVLPPRGCGMFIAPFLRIPAGPADGAPAPAFSNLPDHLFWAFAARRDALAGAGDLRSATGADLQQQIAHSIGSWHPDLRRLVAESDPDGVMAVRLSSAEPVGPWPTTNVTLLGDAIHTMTPLQGLGGNTALRDAALLCR